jgi:GNAT superfamily N-acetyltransferase
MHISIQPLTSAELDGTDEVIKAAYNVGPARKESLQRYLALQPDGCFVVKDDSTMIGFGGALDYDSFAYIGLMSVHPTMQKRGIGGLLLERPMAWLDARESQTGRQVHPQRGWESLNRLNYSKRVLRPRHAQADPAPSLAAQRLPAPPRRPAALPVALSLQFCAAGFWPDGVGALAHSENRCLEHGLSTVRPSGWCRPSEADLAGSRSSRLA